MKNIYILLVTVLLAGYWFEVHGQVTPAQGDLLVTEIMVNPEAVSDANGEWFEIWNSTDHDLLLNGLILKDAGSNEHVVTAPGNLVLPAKGYWVMARNGDILTNGGVTVHYVYQNFTLGNTSDQVMIMAPDGRLIDQVSYGDAWPVISGASMELHPDHHTFGGNDSPANWFPARLTFGSGDKGSPGKANPVSAGLEEWEQGIRVDVYPNPTVGPFILEASFSQPESGEIRLINLLGQEFLYKSFSGMESIREIIECEFLAPGLWFIEVFAGERVRTTRLVVEK